MRLSVMSGDGSLSISGTQRSWIRVSPMRITSVRCNIFIVAAGD